MQLKNTLDFARSLDRADPLQSFRKEFLIPQRAGKDAIYFLGNSLGLQPVQTQRYIQQVLQQWQDYGVEGFFEGPDPWLQYHNGLAGPLAAIVGALPQEVVIMNQLTVNLHLMMASFYNPAGKRVKIICEAKAFPSDQYMLETHVRQRGLNPEEVIVEVAPPAGEPLIRHSAILKAIEEAGDSLALVLWGGVNYYTGQLFDMKGITEAAHAVGAKVGFDLAHAAGNVALELHGWDVDFACWCNYKYLNSGPGAVGAAYIHERYHADASVNRFAGWWGYKKEERFLMQKGFQPVASAEGWGLSTPSPVLYAAHKAALELFTEATPKAVFEKGRLLSSYLLFLLQEINQQAAEGAIQILTPENGEERGCQVSMLMLKNGKAVFDALTQHHIFADWREPNVIRIAPVPLYNRFEEVWQFGQILEKTIISL